MTGSSQIRRATGADAVEIAEVHVASWRSAYRGLLPQELLDGLSVEQRSELWATLWVLVGNTRARTFHGRHGWVPDGASQTLDLGGVEAAEVRYRRELRVETGAPPDEPPPS